MVSGLRNLGKTVVLTTHYMDEAQALADRLAIMARGQIVREGTPDELTTGSVSTTIRFRLPNECSLPGEFAANLAGGEYSIPTNEPTVVLHRLTGWSLEQGVELRELSVGRTSLEEVYLQITKDTETES